MNTRATCPACEKTVRTVFQYDKPYIPNRDKPREIAKHRGNVKTARYGICSGTGSVVTLEAR